MENASITGGGGTRVSAPPASPAAARVYLAAMQPVQPTAPSAYPMAPTETEWAALSPEARARVVADLPASMTDAEASPPEGDLHYDGKNDVRETLRTWFSRLGQRVYIAAELTVYYPGQPRFAPDVLAVRDVPVHDRMKWVVSAEGKGLDWVMEVHVGGDRKKDSIDHVARYAALGIPEYFIFDRAQVRLFGYRLPSPDARTYVPIVPQVGRYPSAALGLDLVLEAGRLRFYHASAELLAPRDLAAKLELLVEEVRQHAEARVEAEAERARAEADRARAETERAHAEAARADGLAAELSAMRAELERLRRGE